MHSTSLETSGSPISTPWFRSVFRTTSSARSLAALASLIRGFREPGRYLHADLSGVHSRRLGAAPHLFHSLPAFRSRRRDNCECSR